MRILLGIFVVASSLLMVASALAHAEPLKATPGDGAVLAAPPAEIVLEMTQEMAREAGANDIDVLEASGREVTTVAAVIDNGNRKKLSVPLPSALPVGVYTVRWKTLSADDGDAAEGVLSFTYDPSKPPNGGKTAVRDDLLGPGPSDPATPSNFGAGDTGRSWVLVIAVGLAAFVLGGGGAFLLVQKRS
jgi:methionine-rich copper-binding protein CopC